MPDISMCKSQTCPLKENCYRYTAKPGFWQSYAEFEYVELPDGKVECDYFWDNKGYKKDESLQNKK